jgi:hypothetical protein
MDLKLEGQKHIDFITEKKHRQRDARAAEREQNEQLELQFRLQIEREKLEIEKIKAEAEVSKILKFVAMEKLVVTEQLQGDRTVQCVICKRWGSHDSSMSS